MGRLGCLPFAVRGPARSLAALPQKAVEAFFARLPCPSAAATVLALLGTHRCHWAGA